MPSSTTPATLADVARRAGVHLSTASRVLHSEGTSARGAASEKTAERIRQVAREMHYTRDPAGRQLRTRRSRELAVMVPRLSDLVLATIYEAIQARASECGYTAYVSNTQDRPDLREELTASALTRRSDGLIFGDADLDPTFLDGLRDRGVPLVLVSRRSGDHISATADDTMGGRLVAEHLLSLGHQRLAVLGGSPWASTGVDRVDGFVDRLAEGRVEVDAAHRIMNGFDARAGYDAAMECLGGANPPTAIFAVNDFTAIGAMGAAHALGLVVGKDVAVVGYNDTGLAEVGPYPLTTVRSPMRDMGVAAVDLLVGMLEGDAVASTRLAPELVVRESSLGRPARG